MQLLRSHYNLLKTTSSKKYYLSTVTHTRQLTSLHYSLPCTGNFAITLIDTDYIAPVDTKIVLRLISTEAKYYINTY